MERGQGKGERGKGKKGEKVNTEQGETGKRDNKREKVEMGTKENKVKKGETRGTWKCEKRGLFGLSFQ